MAWYRPYPYV